MKLSEEGWANKLGVLCTVQGPFEVKMNKGEKNNLTVVIEKE